jgi:hypothetical protein
VEPYSIIALFILVNSLVCFFKKKNSVKCLFFFFEKPVELIDFTRIVHVNVNTIFFWFFFKINLK